MALDKHDMAKIENTFSRYAKIMSEDFHSQFRVVAEMILEHGKKLENHGKKLDALFEMVAQNSVDITIIKSRLEVIEKDVSEIKKEIKSKVDLEKVKTLEKNILVLKRKMA